MRSQRRRVTQILTAAVWRQEPPHVTDDELARVVVAAERNQVQGELARAYPDRLESLRADVAARSEAFLVNLDAAVLRLYAAGVRPVLIKLGPGPDHVYSNFDLVVGTQRDRAQRALAGWYVRVSGHPLEPDKLLLHPAQGPAAHLHRDVAWFGVPVLDHETLSNRAGTSSRGCLEPAEADSLAIWLAHGVFQNLALDLSELAAIRPLLRSEVVETAERFATAQGWGAAFRAALDVSLKAVAHLDRGSDVPVPVPLSSSTSLAVLREHVPHLAHTRGWTVAGREVVLRPALTAVKRTRLALA